MLGLGDNAYISGFFGGVCASLLGWSFKAWTQTGNRSLPSDTEMMTKASNTGDGKRRFGIMANCSVFAPGLMRMNSSERLRFGSFVRDFSTALSSSSDRMVDESGSISDTQTGCIEAPIDVTKNSSLEDFSSALSTINSTIEAVNSSAEDPCFFSVVRSMGDTDEINE